MNKQFQKVGAACQISNSAARKSSQLLRLALISERSGGVAAEKGATAPSVGGVAAGKVPTGTWVESECRAMKNNSYNKAIDMQHVAPIFCRVESRAAHVETYN